MAFSKPSAKTTSLVAGGAAGVLGVALLTSGGGTFAAWSDTTTVTAGTIQSGSLTIDGDVTGTWTDAGVTIPDIASYEIVPGDTITYTVQIPVTVEGENLDAKIITDASGVSDGGLAQYLSYDVAVKGPGDKTSTAVDMNSRTDATTIPALKIDKVETGTYTVTTTITFNGATDGRKGQGKSLDLGDLTVTLEQVL